MQRMNLMIRLSTLSRSSERGAVATIVAMLLGFGVVLGFAAISIDVGSLMWERRQVQNGADATALALAKTCAIDPANCVAGGADQPLLNQLNNTNNTMDNAGGFDNSAYALGLCGRANTLPGVCRLDRCADRLPPAPRQCGGEPEHPVRRGPHADARHQRHLDPADLAGQDARGGHRQRRRDRAGLRAGGLRFARPHRGLGSRSPSRCASGVRTRAAERLLSVRSGARPAGTSPGPATRPPSRRGR